MFKVIFHSLTGALLLLVLAGTVSAADPTINGAGASFPAPLYLQWAYKYHQINPDVQINYQSIGSGAGLQQIKNGTVDFGGSDAPLKKAELDTFSLVQFPMVMGGVVPVINLPGVMPGQLKLDGPTLADIFLGKIAKWNDKAIAALNPDVKLPNQAIAVVHRADGSGTTWIFTNYLALVSPAWKEKVGADKSVAWPTGLGGKGNEGVAVSVQQIPGAIGYVEYAYALQNKMTHLQLKNHEGNFVNPTAETFSAAAAAADWKNAPGFYMVLVNQPGKDAWPITGATFILIHKDLKNAAIGKTLLTFFDWCFKHGQEQAEKLDYVPMPSTVVDLVEGAWKTQVSSGGKPLWP